MYADLDKIKWLLENKTAYNIGKITGIPNQVIQRLNTGERDVESIKFSTAIKLTQYAEQEMMKENIQ